MFYEVHLAGCRVQDRFRIFPINCGCVSRGHPADGVLFSAAPAAIAVVVRKLNEFQLSRFHTI